jgi:hypothetical protein
VKPLYPILLLLFAFTARPACAADPLADFSLNEVNTLSNRYRVTTTPVSPRNYQHQVTAWYYGHET